MRVSTTDHGPRTTNDRPRRAGARWSVLLALLTAWLPAVPAAAQPAEALSDSAAVSLLTMLPGEEVYSAFGHSAFRIHDPALGLDRTYNFGTFDFEQPFFVVRFLRGQLDYLLDTAPYDAEVYRYWTLGRPVVEQHLALPPETVRALYAMLEENALPENRAYRYDFFYDNCSTRLLDALDSALVASGQPALTLRAPYVPRTFRAHLQPYLDGAPLLDLGIDLGLGLPTDRAATAREATFLPVELMRQAGGAASGGRPLVARTDTLFWFPGYTATGDAFDWPLALAAALLALGLGATLWGAWRRRTASGRGRLGDAVLFAVAGAAGLIMAFLWLGTEHTVTGPNLNLLWAWPTHTAAAWGLRRAALPGWLRGYLYATAAVTGLTAVLWGWLPQVLPTPALFFALLLTARALVRARFSGMGERGNGRKGD
ncbi:MAG TPA: DUF4105 domain-containing protein [Rubricoccaceae bacterium]|nr:DUF4105 domain-containing protein [Rubricoccaceae bacterium]